MRTTRRPSRSPSRCSAALSSAFAGRIAQRESARFTRGRSLVRSQLRPLRKALVTGSFFFSAVVRRQMGEHIGEHISSCSAGSLEGVDLLSPKGHRTVTGPPDGFSGYKAEHSSGDAFFS